MIRSEPSHQLSTFVLLAARLLPCTGDRFTLPGGIEVVLNRALPNGVAIFVGGSGHHEDRLDALSYAMMLKEPVFDLMDNQHGVISP